MLLASPLPCDGIAAQAYRTPLYSPLPLSARQRTNSRSSSIPLSIQRTCNALQSMLANVTTPQTHATSVANNSALTSSTPPNAPTLARSQQSTQATCLLQSPALARKQILTSAPTRPELLKRRASRLSVITTHCAPADVEKSNKSPRRSAQAPRASTPPPPPLLPSTASAPRGANKRRRSDSDDVSRATQDHEPSQQQPSTPKRQRRIPAELPQGLKATDFDAISESIAVPLPSACVRVAPLRRRSHQDERTLRQPPTRVLQRPAHHRRASSSAMMSLFFTSLQLDAQMQSPNSQAGGEQRCQRRRCLSPDASLHRYNRSLPDSSDTAIIELAATTTAATSTTTNTMARKDIISEAAAAEPESESILLGSWEDAQLEQISRGMAVRGRMRIRRPVGGRAERGRVDGMGWSGLGFGGLLSERDQARKGDCC